MTIGLYYKPLPDLDEPVGRPEGEPGTGSDGPGLGELGLVRFFGSSTSPVLWSRLVVKSALQVELVLARVWR